MAVEIRTFVRVNLIIAALLVASTLFVCSQRVFAQGDIVGGTGREELNRPVARPTPKTQRTSAAPTRIVYLTRNAKATVSTGVLSVSAPTNSTIRLEPLNGGVALQGVVPQGERIFVFPPLRPGSYRVAVNLDGYSPIEEKVQIAANKTKGITLEPEPILYTVKITTNVASGEVRYATVEPYTENGEKKYRATGETKLVPIENSQAVLAHLLKGIYGVDIRPSDPGYEAKLGSVTVPDGTDNTEVSLPVTLKSRRSTANLTSALNAEEWELPPDWRIVSSLLNANGKGIAIPKLEMYRNYTDFQMISDVKMINGVAASFIVRADTKKQDYYLIRLTGPNASDPYLMIGYLVRNGIRERLQSVRIAHMKSTIKPNQYFTLRMTMKDNSIEVGVTNTETGEYSPLGAILDSNRSFPIGAVGIYGEDREQNQFGSFIICTPLCPSQ